MAFTAEFFQFSKKRNSTKQPTLGSGTTFTTVNLKDDCSLLNPIITVRVASMAIPTVAPINTFTYCHIAKFNRYYFVEDWVYTSGMWEAHLTIDVLASHKVSIGASSQYVVRSASSNDGSITDILYPTTTNITQTRTTKNMNFDSTGFYVIGIINNSSFASEGAIAYYLMTADELGDLKAYLMSNTFLSNNGLYSNPDLSADMVKVLYNPFQYIVSCKFYPFSIPPYTDPVGSINFGWWMLPVAAKRIPSGGYIVTKTSASYTVPSHPQVSRGTYLNHAPYTDIVLYHPLLGTVPLDMAKIDAGDAISVAVSCETVTGLGYINVVASTGGVNKLLYQATTQIAIDIPLAQMNIDSIAMARTAVNTVGNTVKSAMNLDMGGVITSIGNGVLDALEASAPILQSSGAPGNRASYSAPLDICLIQRTVVDDDNTDRGRPLCKVKTINTLSGYIKVADAHIAIPCLSNERSMIEEFMMSGFFYE